MLLTTGNKGYFKVPLCCIVEFMGFEFLCVGKPGKSFEMVPVEEKDRYVRQVEEL